MTVTWDRQPYESGKAFFAFSLYRDMGVDRSLQKVALELSKSLPLIKRWSCTHRWGERVLAFEDHEQRVCREVREEMEREAAARYVRREIELRERIFENEERAVLLEREMLDRFERTLEELPIVKCEEFTNANGTPVKYVLKPAVPDTILAAKRLHEIAARSVSKKLEFEDEVKQQALSEEEREELRELAGDPRLGELFKWLFPQKPALGEEGSANSE